VTRPTPRRAVPADPAAETAVEAGAEVDVEATAEAVQVLTSEREALIHIVMLTIGLDRARAEDVLHDVVLRVLSRGVPADVADWLGYLRTAVIREGVTVLRKVTRENEVAALAAFHQQADTAHAAAVRRILHDALGDLDVLTREERAVFVLFHYGGLTREEIAEHLGLSSHQVKRRHRGAKAKLAARREAHHRDPSYLAVLAVLRRPTAPGSAGTTVTAATASTVTAGVTAAAMVGVLAVVARVVGVPLPYVRPLPEPPRWSPCPVLRGTGRATRGSTPARAQAGPSRGPRPPRTGRSPPRARAGPRTRPPARRGPSSACRRARTTAATAGTATPRRTGTG
jgi:RNA polymerase sigma factor (sigma-70 family)